MPADRIASDGYGSSASATEVDAPSMIRRVRLDVQQLKGCYVRKPLVVLACLALSAGVAWGVTRLVPHATKACGGYHIVIDNGSGSEVALAVNGQTIRNLPRDETADISEWGNWHAGAMPWDLVVTRMPDGQPLLAVHLEDDGTDGRRVRLEQTPQSQADLAAYSCGQT
jgi:hypothetical protein